MIEGSDDVPGTGTDLGAQTDWADLVREHQAVLYGICRRFALTREDSDDAVQHAWLKLYERRSSLRHPDRVRAWLGTTVRRECIALRSARWRESPHADPPGGAMEVDVTELIASRQAHDRLTAAIQQLPCQERSVVLLLLDPSEPSYAEMAQRLNMSIGSIGPHRGRALRHLRILMSDLTEEDAAPSRAPRARIEACVPCQRRAQGS
jgi:RNA polymerase sigma factor (sigma-70 family)